MYVLLSYIIYYERDFNIIKKYFFDDDIEEEQCTEGRE